MKRFLAYLGGRATNGIVNYGLGDWYDLGSNSPGYSQLTPVSLTATAFYFQDASILARVAPLLGDTGDAQVFQKLADGIRTAFNAKFFDPVKRSYATGSQTANAIPLVMGICETSNRAAVLDAIVRDVRTRGNALTAGDVGYRYLLRALAEGARSDVIFDINNQSDKPGYGYQLRKGATSLTEAWDANRSSSQDHFMLGQINEWFFRNLAGITPDAATPGFRNVVIHPDFVGDLTWVKARYESVHGSISSQWERKGQEISLAVEIPPGTTGKVILPAKPGDEIRESGAAASKALGVKLLQVSDGVAEFEIASGKYQFSVSPRR